MWVGLVLGWVCDVGVLSWFGWVVKGCYLLVGFVRKWLVVCGIDYVCDVWLCMNVV